MSAPSCFHHVEFVLGPAQVRGELVGQPRCRNPGTADTGRSTGRGQRIAARTSAGVDDDATRSGSNISTPSNPAAARRVELVLQHSRQAYGGDCPPDAVIVTSRCRHHGPIALHADLHYERAGEVKPFATQWEGRSSAIRRILVLFFAEVAGPTFAQQSRRCIQRLLRLLEHRNGNCGGGTSPMRSVRQVAHGVRAPATMSVGIVSRSTVGCQYWSCATLRSSSGVVVPKPKNSRYAGICSNSMSVPI